MNASTSRSRRIDEIVHIPVLIAQGRDRDLSEMPTEEPPKEE